MSLALELGIKSDPIEYRYSFRWLFELMDSLDVRRMQLGSFFEVYRLPDRYFQDLRSLAQDFGIRIDSCFTAHRELGGFFHPDPAFHQVAFDSYSRYLEVGAILGADSVGSNPGAVFRDEPATKAAGLARYMGAMEALSEKAHGLGLKALTVEPMSCLAEPPSTPEEIRDMMGRFAEYHAEAPEGRAPVYLCGDISHGIADATGRVVHDNYELFEMQLPWMWEFHFKNTDAMFNSTFGFGPSEQSRGIVDLPRLRRILDAGADRLPRAPIVGYLEIGGPKLGRDYSDPLLREALGQSIAAIRQAFEAVPVDRI